MFASFGTDLAKSSDITKAEATIRERPVNPYVHRDTLCLGSNVNPVLGLEVVNSSVITRSGSAWSSCNVAFRCFVNPFGPQMKYVN